MIESLVLGLFLFIGTMGLKSFVRSLKPASLLERITSSGPSSAHSINPIAYLRERIQLSHRASNKNSNALYELPDLINLLAVGIAAGESLHSSLSFVTSRASGVVAQEFRIAMNAIELGSSLEEELKTVASRLPQTQLMELCNKLTMTLKRGTSLSHILSEQAQSIRSEIQIQRIKQAGKNETRMMIPLVFLILPVTVLFAIFPSLSFMNIEII
jgi:tight adherence protein C